MIMRDLMIMSRIRIGCCVALSLLLLAFSGSAWGDEDGPRTFLIPEAAKSWKRQYLSAARSIWGLDLPSWLAAQVEQESGWRDGLTSSAGARGLCQFIPATARSIEDQYEDLAEWGRYSPQWCFYAQNLLMRDLYQTFHKNGRDNCNGIKFAGSAYNGGPTMLNREIALCTVDPDCDNDKWSENVATKNARANWAWRENRTYVQRITAREAAYALGGWGIPYCKE